MEISPGNQDAAKALGIDAQQLEQSYQNFLPWTSSQSWRDGVMGTTSLIDDALTVMRSDPALNEQIKGLLKTLNGQLIDFNQRAAAGAVQPDRVIPDVENLERAVYPTLKAAQDAVAQATPYLRVGADIPAGSKFTSYETDVLGAAVKQLKDFEWTSPTLDASKIPLEVTGAIKQINDVFAGKYRNPA